MEPIRINVHFTEKDYIRLNFLMSYRNPLLLVSTVVGLLMAVHTAFTFRNESAPLNNEFGIFVSLIILVYAPIRIFFRSRKTYRKAPKAENVTYAFDPEGFNVTGKNFDLSQPWKQVHSVREIGSWYMIYIGPGKAHYIPAVCFTSNEQEMKFRELVRGTGRPAKLKYAK